LLLHLSYFCDVLTPPLFSTLHSRYSSYYLLFFETSGYNLVGSLRFSGPRYTQRCSLLSQFGTFYLRYGLFQPLRHAQYPCLLKFFFFRSPALGQLCFLYLSDRFTCHDLLSPSQHSSVFSALLLGCSHAHANSKHSPICTGRPSSTPPPPFSFFSPFLPAVYLFLFECNLALLTLSYSGKRALPLFSRHFLLCDQPWLCL